MMLFAYGIPELTLDRPLKLSIVYYINTNIREMLTSTLHHYNDHGDHDDLFIILKQACIKKSHNMILFLDRHYYEKYHSCFVSGILFIAS